MDQNRDEIRIEDLPIVLKEQIEELEQLGIRIQKTKDLAELAKDRANAANVKIGLFQSSSKDAIIKLQNTCNDLAEGLLGAAEAQEFSFTNQKKITLITRFLFLLGTSNLAMNRAVTKELEMKLKSVAEDSGNELAKEELKNVILQLKEQEDFMVKQERLSSLIKENTEKLEMIDGKIIQINELDNVQEEKIKENNASISHGIELLEKQKKEHVKYEQKIINLKNQFDNHSNAIKKQNEKMNEYDSKLKKQEVETNKIQKLIKEQLKEYLNKYNTLEYNYNAVIKTIKEDIVDVMELSKKENEVLDTKLLLLSQDLSAKEEGILYEINATQLITNSSIEELKEEISKNKNEVDTKLTLLKEKIDQIDNITNHFIWNICVATISGIPFIVMLLHLLGII